jgi:glycosyltransferase involved in cell wall biosynthesis
MAPIRTLHIDIEGGWGGSSRSLFELVRRLDRRAVEPVVVYRDAGPAADWYAGIGVPAYRVSKIASYVPRRAKALKNLVASMPSLLGLPKAAADIAEIANRHRTEILHLNYEGLFLLGRRLKRMLPVPVIAHSRAHLPRNMWARWLARTLARVADQVFFISPQEAQRWRDLVPGASPPGEVLWNITREPRPREPFASPPEAVYLGNLDWTKGTDRLIDIAAALDRGGAPPLTIAVYGSSRNRAGFAAELEARVAAQGLGARIAFRGHVADPMSVLARAFALIRPSREDDPWGRDVIEATCAGVPVFATGTFDGVVRPGVNGFLFAPFEAEAVAGRLAALLQDAGAWQRLSEAGRAAGANRFAGPAQAEIFAAALRRLARPDAERVAA